jgi:hypothetical protein
VHQVGLHLHSFETSPTGGWTHSEERTFNFKCSGLKVHEILSARTNMTTESKKKPG